MFHRSLFYLGPFVVPYWGKEEFETILRTFLRNRLAEGEYVERFEREFSQRFNVRYVVATSLGRGAIYLGLNGLGLCPGDEVILPSFACLAIIQPVLRLGGTPVFVDINEDLNIDPRSVEECLSEKTRAIIVPHLCGKIANIGEIISMVRERGIFVIDDAAQACGAILDGKLAGTHGDLGVFSFGMGKNIMATQGGLLVTNSHETFEKAVEPVVPPENPSEVLLRAARVILEFRLRRYTLNLYRIARKIRMHVGGKEGDTLPHTLPPPERMSNLDAGLALIQLSKLSEIVRRRVRNAKVMSEVLRGVEKVETPSGSYPGHVFTKYAIRVKDGSVDSAYDRAKTLVRMAKYLARRGVEVEWLYTPLHLRRSLDRYKRVELRKTEELYRRTICVPINPFLTEEQVAHIGVLVKVFLEHDR